MTEEERPEAKEQEACFAAIREIVQEISRLMDAAHQQYSRLVEQVLNGRITEEREIERIMDGLVDFGDNPRLLELYKTLCRHVYYKYPALVGEHTALFRLQFEDVYKRQATCCLLQKMMNSAGSCKIWRCPPDGGRPRKESSPWRRTKRPSMYMKIGVARPPP